MKSILSFLVIFLSSQLVLAQNKLEKDSIVNVLPSFDFELEFGGVMLAYKGDLSNSFSNFSSGLSLGIQSASAKRVSGRLGIIAGTVVGNLNLDDLNSSVSSINTFFSSSILALDLGLKAKLLERGRFKAFFYQSAGILFFKSVDKEGNLLKDQFKTRTQGESYGNSGMMLPSKIGFSYTLPNKIQLATKIGYLNLKTDYLDNISYAVPLNKRDNILTTEFLIRFKL